VLDRWLLGRPLATSDEQQEQLSAPMGVPVLGLDSLASAAYGPEAALTLLIPLGVAGGRYLLPIAGVICVILAIVAWSYRQTIAAYPGSGGSFIVARENLGERIGSLAASALAIDYVLNVAVGISAGIAAITSAVPSLLPHTLVLCLAVLAVIVLANLRGIRQSGFALAIPTVAFVAVLALVIGLGVVRSITAGGAPQPEAALPKAPAATEAVSLWLLVRAFASGTTAMTGVEAVSNAVPLFRDPAVKRARRTLTTIIAILIVLVIGVAYLCRAYHITATPPGQRGYQSVLSLVTGAVLGRGVLYDIAMVAILAVLALSANTSFAAFPRLCRQLAMDEYLPPSFADRGRRLVASRGILLLAALAALLLLAFGGVTDRLIPLFAIGALLAFTLSQAGMVGHWRRNRGPHARRHMAINGLGATATGITIAIVIASKFLEGAWIVVVVVPAIWYGLSRVRRHYRGLAQRLEAPHELELPDANRPIAIVAASTWNRLTRAGIRFALAISDEVYVVELRTEHDRGRVLADDWDRVIHETSSRARTLPSLIVVESRYREFFKPFVELVGGFERDHAERTIAVVLPELVPHRWYQGLFHGTRARLLQVELLQHCSDRVVVVAMPVHVDALPHARADASR
jgi:amino acid transporter